MKDVEGAKLLPHCGKNVLLYYYANRFADTAYNVIGRKGRNPQKRIVITAHIDAKKGTPGAIDNATG
jgi:aminopeptidase YwaD